MTVEGSDPVAGGAVAQLRGLVVASRDEEDAVVAMADCGAIDATDAEDADAVVPDAFCGAIDADVSG